jgi:hypothetical protein
LAVWLIVGEWAATGLGEATGAAGGAGSVVGLGLATVGTLLALGAGVGAGAAAGVGSGMPAGWSAALEFSSRDKKLPLPSAVEDAVLVPDISADRVLVLRAVLVSESMLICAFQTESRLTQQIPGHSARPRIAWAASSDR